MPDLLAINITKTLKTIDLFSSVPEAFLMELAKLFAPFELVKGDFLYQQHENRSKIWIVIAGTLSTEQDGVVLNQITELPATIAWSSLFLRDILATTSLRATSEQPVKGYYCLKTTFEGFVKQHPDLNASVLEFLASQVRKWRRAPTDVHRVKKAHLLQQMVVFDSKSYDVSNFKVFEDQYLELGIEIVFVESKLSPETVALARDAKIVCVFVNDNVNAFVVDKLSRYGVELVTLRSAGFNNVDLDACVAHNISVTRVPKYSPYSVAEHAVALMLSLNRKICIASSKTKTGDFSLSTFLTGFDMNEKVVGVIGTGKIGKILVGILLGFNCKVKCFDVYQDAELAANPRVEYLPTVQDLFPICDIISLHSPLLPSTQHMINPTSLSQMKRGVMLINTSRGGLIDTMALIEALKSGQVGYAGLDVYENEQEYFFNNLSDKVIQDDSLSRLLSFNNVIVTSHQAFLTKEALEAISKVTFSNCKEFIEDGKRRGALINDVAYSKK